MINKSSVFFIFLFSFLLIPISVYSDSKVPRPYEIVAHVVQDNEAQGEVQVIAKNYQEALEVIQNGSLSEEHYSHYTFSNIEKKFSVDGDKILLTDDLFFGRGVKVSKENAKKIVEILYVNAPSFLNIINNPNKTKRDPEIMFTNPEIPRQKVTNNKGITTGKVYGGFTIFTNSNSSDLVFLDVEKSQEIYVGNTVKNDDIDVNISNIKPNYKKNKSSDKEYSADYGQDVIYTIKINKASDVILSSTPNFKISEISVPAKIEPKFTNNIKNSKSSDVENGDFAIQLNSENLKSAKNLDGEVPVDDVVDYASDKLASLKFLYQYRISKEQAPKGTEITVKGKIVGINKERFKLIYDNGINVYEKENQEFNIQVDSYEQGIVVSEIVSNKEIFHLSPLVTSGGINFATYDGHSEKLISGGKYIIGRYNEDDNSIYTYNGTEDNSPKWEKQNLNYDKDFETNDLSLSNAKTLTSNAINYIDGHNSPIELSNHIWGLNKEKNIKINESLIHVRGLSNNYKYFITQVSPPEGYKSNNKIVKFEINKNSISEAQFGNYLINGAIPDNEFQKNEYNALSNVKKGEKENKIYNPYILTFIGVASIVIVSIIIVVGLLKYS
ncbi:hypothetical protein BG262_08025 [Floricoccus penangensis]|uniref:Uncharacterized protein n=1 Tax=Floricoccus penangensis TaxID=1859475 RepID=A0A9Q5JI15_9LACT|nr:hypothetical protein [Floricoccus penangensis]OFI47929.1 hypothetical protein BG262_08025 [Floricoccus penangensis]